MSDRGALVHDESPSRSGGSENVFDATVVAISDADLLWLSNDRPDRYPRSDLGETWFPRTPLRRNKVAALPFIPATWRRRRPGNVVGAVAVSGADAITSDAVRRLGWDLEGSGIDLALTLALIDVVGPRVLMRPVNGLPLMYVDELHFTGPKYALKSAFDWLGALFITIVLSPVLALIAVLVATTSRGPIFFTQERVGRDGRRFRMVKFRSMEVGAQYRLAEVLALEGVTSVGMFYKPKNDPPVTPSAALSASTRSTSCRSSSTCYVVT